jgi:exodeoxyribonuclease V alpha subunit
VPSDLGSSITQPSITIDGTLTHITFHNQENHYTVARLKTGFPRTTVTVVGPLPAPRAGETVRLSGQWTTHSRYGQQFAFDTAEVLLPADIDGIRTYLSSGILPGIGPVLTEKIIDRFLDQTLAVIREQPERLTEIDGIGEKKAAAIHAQWQAHHLLADVMQFLSENGISTAHSGKIVSLYGPDALAMIRQDPYQLANDIPGMDFATADRIARNLGLEINLYDRAQACILHILRSAAGQGHVFVNEKTIVDQVGTMDDMDFQTVQDSLEDLAASGDIQFSISADPDALGRAVYLDSLWQAEQAIAGRMLAMLSVATPSRCQTLDAVLAEVENQLIISLSAEQRDVLENIVSCRISIITGGPGTGKTTLIKAITEMNRIFGRRICLCAPTGRAARRLADVTGHPAHTIHKLLEYNFQDQRFGKDRDDPISADILIIDEFSMVDTVLMYHLMDAVPLSATVIMVGDAHQLPPVGPGNLLNDMIQSKILPVFHLNRIFRQAMDSRIIVNAHRIRAGKLPVEMIPDGPGLEENPLDGNLPDALLTPDAEFCFIEQPTPEQTVSCIINLCRRTLPDRFGLHPVTDIQVLTPMHKGVAGTINLNRRLQQVLNRRTGEPSSGVSGFSSGFSAGDKVMHLKNNYQKDVYNGDVGTITRMDEDENRLWVNFYDRTVEYAAEDMSELTLGYAISVHKSQGSEYPAVILPVITQHYVMLQRNLLYTAITRAKQLVILVGTKKAVSIAVNNNRPEMRLSGLARRLAEGLQGRKIF